MIVYQATKISFLEDVYNDQVVKNIRKITNKYEK